MKIKIKIPRQIKRNIETIKINTYYKNRIHLLVLIVDKIHKIIIMMVNNKTFKKIKNLIYS